MAVCWWRCILRLCTIQQTDTIICWLLLKAMPLMTRIDWLQGSEMRCSCAIQRLGWNICERKRKDKVWHMNGLFLPVYGSYGWIWWTLASSIICSTVNSLFESCVDADVVEVVDVVAGVVLLYVKARRALADGCDAVGGVTAEWVRLSPMPLGVDADAKRPDVDTLGLNNEPVTALPPATILLSGRCTEGGGEYCCVPWCWRFRIGWCCIVWLLRTIVEEANTRWLSLGCLFFCTFKKLKWFRAVRHAYHPCDLYINHVSAMRHYADAPSDTHRIWYWPQQSW